MRIARVIGLVTLNRCVKETRRGRYLIAEAFDRRALAGRSQHHGRAAAMPESLVVFDDLGAGMGQIIAVSEGRQAAMPFYPERVCIDAYNTAILDHVEFDSPE